MKIINRYTKNKKKIAYTLLMRSLLKFNARVSTFLVKLNKKRFLNPQIKKVFIETLSFCNNTCTFCPASVTVGEKNPKNKMTMETFEKIIEQLKGIKFKGVLALYCNNEPLLDSRMPSFIKRLRNEFPANRIDIISNGTRLNASLANVLFESGLSKLLINHYDNRLQLSQSLNKFVQEFSNSSYQDKVHIYLRLKDEVLSNRAGNASNAVIPEESLSLWCSLPFEQLYLNYAGDVVLCCADVLWENILGNINRSPIKEIWNSQKFSYVRKSLLEGKRDKINSCKKCDFLGVKHDPKGMFDTMGMVLGLK